MSIDGLNNLLLWLDQYLGGSNYFPYLLLGTGLFFTFYLKFPQVRYFKHAWRVVSGKYAREGAQGDTTHFQALTTALSGTVGTGNIGGVALAVHLGGPAALFWMWATAFVGMTTKFVEVTLSHKYRVKTDNGTMAGGPMYYMERKLGMKWLAVIFSVAIVISAFGAGNMPQSNSIAAGMNATFGLSPIITGGILAVLLFMVIVGGIHRIAQVTEAIVPSMAMLYLIGAIGVIIYNADQVIPSFLSIFAHLFSGTAATGGFLGASFAYAFSRGVNRGLFSNEAGEGSAPIAHASAKGDEPVSEGMVSILEPFINTIVICTITGLVLLSSGVWHEKFENQFQRTDMEYVAGVYDDAVTAYKAKLFKHVVAAEDDPIQPFTGSIQVVDGSALVDKYTLLNASSVAEKVRYAAQGKTYTGTLQVENGKLVDTDIPLAVSGFSLLHSVPLTTVAFNRSIFGDYGQYIVAIGLLLFAFSTAISWSYYGDRAIIYLVGFKWVKPYRVVYVLGFFLAAFTDTTVIWSLAAVVIVLTTIPNLFGILMLRKDMKQSVQQYWDKFRAGPVD